jgi:hypothetical protein
MNRREFIGLIGAAAWPLGFIRAVPPEHKTLPTALALALKPHFEQIAVNVEQVEKIARARGLGRVLMTHRKSASGANRKTFARSVPYRF